MNSNKKNLHCDINLCGALCCRNCPVLTEDEAASLIVRVKEEYNLELNPKKYFRKAKGEHGIYFAVKMIKGECIFLNKEKRCRIYRCRPALCELYPVIDVDSVDMRCPHVRDKRLTDELVAALKQRYADEVDGKIKIEQKFLFI